MASDSFRRNLLACLLAMSNREGSPPKLANSKEPSIAHTQGYRNHSWYTPHSLTHTSKVVKISILSPLSPPHLTPTPKPLKNQISRINMSDAGRKDWSTKAKEEITPDSSKSTLDKTKESVTDGMDKVAGETQSDSSKGAGQSTFDKGKREKDGTFLDNVKDTLGLNK